MILVRTKGGGRSRFSDMCDVCLSDYHDVDEGLLVIMRIVPAMPVRYHDLVSVERKVSLRFRTRQKGSQRRRKPVTSRQR